MAPRGPRLKEVSVKGKQYYATYRVCSKERSACIMNPKTFGRWGTSGNVWQYGKGFYLFGSKKDARKFIECSRKGAAHLLVKEPRAQVKARETILEILLPKEKFDRSVKSRIKPEMDWAVDQSHPKYGERERLRSQSDILYGRWQEDPQFPFAAYKPMVGTTQLSVVNTGKGTILDDAVVRIATHSGGKAKPVATQKNVSRVKRLRERPKNAVVDRSLPRAQRIDALIQHNRQQHSSLHRLLDGQVNRHQGSKAIDYLSSKFSTARQLYRRESGTWEGFTIRGHTLRAYNVLGTQLKHVNLEQMSRTYPKINVKKTLQLALLLHDIGKPVAIDRARGLVDQTIAAGKSLQDLDRSKLQHHSRYSKSLMSRMMWQLGSNTQEVRLARALVENNAIGQLVQDKTNMTGAAEQIRKHAARTGLDPKDYFKLQSLFFAADAGAYRSLRKSVFQHGPDGQLEPRHIRYQMLSMQLGAD
jgi:hypothetical protein